MTARHAVIREPGVIDVEDGVESDPAPDELLIAPDAVGICGTDLELLDGTMAYLASGRASFPLVPGHEWTGIVRAIGAGVVGFTEGDRVVGETSIGCGRCERCASGAYHLCPDRSETGLFGRDGALGTRMLFPARAAHRIPPHVGRRTAVLLEPLAVAYRALQRAGDAVPERLAIVGGGPVGIACALTARAHGAAHVAVVERDAARRTFAASLGFDADPTPQRWPLVVEATGSPEGLAAAIGLCDDAGTVIALGLTGADSVPVDADDIVVRDLTVVGSLSSAGVWPDVIELVASGKLDASSLVSHEYPLERAAEAFELVRRRPPGTFKVVIRPNEEQ